MNSIQCGTLMTNDKKGSFWEPNMELTTYIYAITITIILSVYFWMKSYPATSLNEFDNCKLQITHINLQIKTTY